MKAAKLVDLKTIRIEEVEKPAVVHADDVLVKVKAVGICGTDLHIFKDGRADVALPRIMGHELSGIVEAVGGEVDNVKVGDHVILDPVISCNTCRICRSGHGNVCASVKCFGVQCDGGFQDYIVVPKAKVFAYDKGVSFNRAALGEPYSIAANILGRAGMAAGETLVVIGAGTIGLAIVQAAKGIGARVLCADIFDQKLEYASGIGADVTVNSKREDLETAIRAFAPDGIDVIIDAVGVTPITQQAINMADPLTRVVIIGFDARPVEIPIVSITKKELTLVGSRMNCNQFPKVVEWLNTGVIQDDLITKVYPFEQIQKAFEDTLAQPETTIKTIITFD